MNYRKMARMLDRGQGFEAYTAKQLRVAVAQSLVAFFAKLKENSL